MFGFLIEVFTNTMSKDRKKKVSLRRSFLFIIGVLYKRGIDQESQRCVLDFEKIVLPKDSHQGIESGHFSSEIIGMKIFQGGLWWPTMLKDAHEFVKQCEQCQREGKPTQVDRIPQQPVLIRTIPKMGYGFCWWTHKTNGKIDKEYVYLCYFY